MTKICIFGAGAIGGYVGGRLAMKGEAEVSLIARGPHLAAMQANGLALKQAGETHVVRPRVTDQAAELGVQDYIILALKAHAVTSVIDARPRLRRRPAAAPCRGWPPACVISSLLAEGVDGRRGGADGLR